MLGLVEESTDPTVFQHRRVLAVCQLSGELGEVAETLSWSDQIASKTRKHKQ